MGSDYFLFYAEASIVCIVIQLMILVNDKYYRTQQEKQIWFGRTIMILFFYIQNTQTLISVDDLTRLNNRGQINRFMDLFQYRENAGLSGPVRRRRVYHDHPESGRG